MAPLIEGEEAAGEESNVGTPVLLLQQDFSKLEQALEDGVWEVDGDDFSLYVGENEEESGAVFVTEGTGGHEARTEIIHRFSGNGLINGGARVSKLTASWLCEALDADSHGMFTLGLAFDEDFEEAALLVVTLRRPRECPGEEQDSEAARSKPVGLHMNGTVVTEDVGDLPARIDLEAVLQWEARHVTLKHRITPACRGDEAAGLPSFPGQQDDSSAVTSGFYTTSVQFEGAKVLFLRGTGDIKVRLLRVACSASSSSSDGKT